MQYVFTQPDITVTAAGIAVTVEGFGAFKLLASQYLLDEGIGQQGPDGMISVKSDEWYDAQSYLNAWRRIASDVSEQIIENAGRATPARAAFPPQLRNIEVALGSLDIAYHMNHKKNGVVMYDATHGLMTEGIGHYRCVRIPGRHQVVMTCDNPYPCAYDRGLITELARRFEPKVKVTHDPRKPCRKRGGESCTYIVDW